MLFTFRFSIDMLGLNAKSKHGSFSLLLSENQFDEYLQEIFPKVKGQWPNFFKLDTYRRPMSINTSSPTCIKNLRYFGTIIVTTMEEIPTLRAIRSSGLLHFTFFSKYNNNENLCKICNIQHNLIYFSVSK